MSDKTKPAYKQTKLWILSVQEIEHVIFDNLILVKSYLYRNYKRLDFSTDTLCVFHKLLCENLFEEAGKYRKHNVQMWDFEPIWFHQVPVEMKKLDDDMQYRLKYAKTTQKRKELLAWIMWKILWIHPFFDYNARVVRLFGEFFLLKYQMQLSSFRWTTRKKFSEAMKKWTSDHDLSDVMALL